MIKPGFIDDLTRLSAFAANNPARDLEKNLKALLTAAFGKLDLVSREEFELQRELLARANAKLAELEARVAALEAEGGKN
jgi:BMFP domain-containing protein YqiC